jgi:hypothetical protein
MGSTLMAACFVGLSFSHLATVRPALAIDTAATYQGRLEDSGLPDSSGGEFITLSTVRAQFALGPEEIVQAAGADITVSGYSVPSMTDWNSDSLPDLLVGEGGSGFDGKARVFLNVGTAADPVFGSSFFVQSEGGDLSVPPTGCQGAFPRVVYWDADARKDLLVGQADGLVRLYFNTGTDVNPVFDQGRFVQVGQPGSKVDIDVGDRATSIVTDWNSDGRKDLVVGAYDGYVRIYLNQGTDTEPDFRTALLAQSSGVPLLVATLRSSPAVADVTDDGNKDLVVGDTDGRLLLYENTGTDDNPTFAGYVNVTSEGNPIDLASSRSRPSLCDWDSDGLDDVVIGSSDGLVRLYRNTGALFADGFETGDTAGWSTTVPAPVYP